MYMIHYRNILSNEWEHMSVADWKTDWTIGNLEPNTSYIIKIQAISERGKGIKSDPIIITTLSTSE